jgi:hypothetical protein
LSAVVGHQTPKRCARHTLQSATPIEK